MEKKGVNHWKKEKLTPCIRGFYIKIDLIILHIELLNYEGDIKGRL